MSLTRSLPQRNSLTNTREPLLDELNAAVGFSEEPIHIKIDWQLGRLVCCHNSPLTFAISFIHYKTRRIYLVLKGSNLHLKLVSLDCLMHRFVFLLFIIFSKVHSTGACIRERCSFFVMVNRLESLSCERSLVKFDIDHALSLSIEGCLSFGVMLTFTVSAVNRQVETDVR